MDLGLAGKTVIVTGGAANIGRAISLGFAKEGVNLVIADLDVPQAEKVAALAKEMGAKDAIVVKTDMTKPEETEALAKARYAIDRSAFNLERRETFCKYWNFEDKEALYNYHFEEYGDSLYDESIVDGMIELLGEKIHDRPIAVEDIVEIISMRKL